MPGNLRLALFTETVSTEYLWLEMFREGKQPYDDD